MVRRILLLFTVAVLAHAIVFSQSVVTITGSGNWSSTTPDAPWPGGTPPGASDEVVIPDGFTLTLDQNATIANLTVGGGTSGVFNTSKTVKCTLTVNGNILANAGSTITAQTATTSQTGFIQTIIVTGNFTFNGSTFKARNGTTGTTLGVLNFTFTGSGNSTISGTGFSTTNVFNAMRIEKSGSGKVVLGCNIWVHSGSSTDALTQAVVTFVNGVIETGTYTFVHLSSTGANMTGYSNASYVLGRLGRCMSSSATTREFPIGDADGYRPIKLHNPAGLTGTGYWIVAEIVNGDANTGSSTLADSLAAVSQFRYYKATFDKGTTAYTGINLDQFYPSYRGTGDGVGNGNIDLRVAYSADARATWHSAGPWADSTNTTASPQYLKSSVLATSVPLNDGQNIYVALGTASTATNPLPVELVSFTAEASRLTATLRWATATEKDCYGFEIERRAVNGGVWSTVGSVAGAGVSNVQHEYSFTDAVGTAGRYAYRLKQIDQDGRFTYFSSQEVEVGGAARTLTLGGYPNPFNPVSSIEFTLAEAGATTVKVYNVIGQEVATLFNGMADAGKIYRTQFNASSLPSGMYIVCLRSGGQTLLHKMTLTK